MKENKKENEDRKYWNIQILIIFMTITTYLLFMNPAILIIGWLLFLLKAIRSGKFEKKVCDLKKSNNPDKNI